MEGILFKSDMIKAIVEGRKTQTRRVVKFPDVAGHRVYKYVYPHPGGGFSFQDFPSPSGIADPVCKTGKMPRYHVDETVYIKEALYRHPYLDEAGYMLDQTPVFVKQTIGDCLKWRWQKDILTGMFMPQEAARYFITITDVRAERLQEITENDAIKEGCRLIARTIQPFELKPNPHFTAPERPFTHKDHFIGIWDSINKPPYDWQANPWCWKYSFKKVEE